MTLSTAVLCLAVCVFDIINKTAMCGTSVDYIITQPFSCSSLAKKWTHTAAPLAPQIWTKSFSVVWTLMEPLTICPFLHSKASLCLCLWYLVTKHTSTKQHLTNHHLRHQPKAVLKEGWPLVRPFQLWPSFTALKICTFCTSLVTAQ